MKEDLMLGLLVGGTILVSVMLLIALVDWIDS